MPGLGTVFVELQLDRSKFNTSLQQLEKDATSVPVQIEKSFQNLGIKSSYQFDLMRQKAILNFEAIAARSESTANDILRAEKAKNDIILGLYAQQNTVASRAMNPYAVAAAQVKKGSTDLVEAGNSAQLSFRHMGGAVNTMTEALGAQNSTMAAAAIHIGMFGRMMRELPSGMGVAALAIVGTTAALIVHMNTLEETRKRTADLNRAIGEFDTSKMRTGMQAAASAMTEIESEGFWNVGNIQDLGRKMLFANTRWEEAKEKLDDFRAAMEKLLPIEKQLADADYAKKAADVRLSAISQQSSSMAAAGTLRPTDTVRFQQQELSAVSDSSSASLAEITIRRNTEVQKAIARGASDSEVAMIREKGARDILILDETTSQRRIQIEEKTLSTLRGLAKQEMDERIAILRSNLSYQQSVADMQGAAESAGRGARSGIYLAGMTPDRQSRFGYGASLSATYEDLAAMQASGAAREKELERTQTQMKAILQGFRAQNLLSEHDYTTQVRAMDQELTAAKLKSLQDYQNGVIAALSSALSSYAKYAEEVRSLDKQIAATKQDTADILAGMKQAGMTPAEAAADKERRANEALADAMTKTAADQVEALRRVQAAYKDLGMEAVKSAADQKEAGKQAWATDRPMEDWRTIPGQHSEAFKQAWAPSESGPGSAAWWSGGAWGNNAWSKSDSGASTAQTMQQKVQQIGDLIVQAQERQRAAASSSADAAQRMVDSMVSAANEAARLAAALASAKAPAEGSTKEYNTLKDTAQATADAVVDEIRRGIGPTNLSVVSTGGDVGGGGSADAGANASGALFNATRRTRMIVGEAGAETVAVLRNPRAADVGSGGVGPNTIVIQLDTREILRQQIPALNDAIRAGWITISGKNSGR